MPGETRGPNIMSLQVSSAVNSGWSDVTECKSLREYEIALTSESALSFNGELIRRAVKCVLKTANVLAAEVSIAIVDDATIHRLNKQFLQHDYPTDVLSFALEDQPGRLVGEIIASAETAARSAAQLDWNHEHELVLYIVHGALHLCGHDDHSLADAALMRSEERNVLMELGIEPTACDTRWLSLNRSSDDTLSGD